MLEVIYVHHQFVFDVALMPVVLGRFVVGVSSGLVDHESRVAWQLRELDHVQGLFVPAPARAAVRLLLGLSGLPIRSVASVVEYELMPRVVRNLFEWVPPFLETCLVREAGCGRSVLRL